MSIESIKAKSDAILELKLEQLNCVKQALKIANKGSSKYHKVNMNRVFRIMGWAVKARMIQDQIRMIAAQPIFPSGGLPIVGDKITITNKINSA